MMEIGDETSMGNDVPSLCTPHIVKYDLWPLMRFVEGTRGCVDFDVAIIILMSDV